MDKEQLAEIHGRVDKASAKEEWTWAPAEWECDCYCEDKHDNEHPDCENGYWAQGATVIGPDMIDSGEYGGFKNEDAEFIARAREDVPKLLDEVELLQRNLDISNGMVDTYQKEVMPGFRGTIIELKSEKEDLQRLRPAEEWDEDQGDVLWWILPICEPPYCGTPDSSNWLEYHTHWTKLLIPDKR